MSKKIKNTSDNSNDEQQERDKKILLWSGVSFFMVMIFLLWIFNMQSIFKGVEQDKNKSFFSNFSINQESTNQTVDQIKNKLNSIKEVSKNQEQGEEGVKDQDQKLQNNINKLKQKFQEIQRTK